MLGLAGKESRSIIGIVSLANGASGSSNVKRLSTKSTTQKPKQKPSSPASARLPSVASAVLPTITVVNVQLWSSSSDDFSKQIKDGDNAFMTNLSENSVYLSVLWSMLRFLVVGENQMKRRSALLSLSTGISYLCSAIPYRKTDGETNSEMIFVSLSKSW